MEELSRKSDIKFNYDDIINLCEFMIRDHLYIKAFCYIHAIINLYVLLHNESERKNNFQPADKISKILGMIVSIAAEVIFFNKFFSKIFLVTKCKIVF